MFREEVIEGDHVGDDGLLVGLVHAHILGVQQLHQTELLLGSFKCVVEVVHCIGLGQLLVLNQVGSVLVDDGIEGQTISPGGREVSNIDIVVASRLDLAPQQEGVLGGPGLLALLLVDGDLLDLEPQDDRPDETQSQPRVSVYDVVRAHVLQVDSLLIQEAQSLVNIFQAVDSHFTFCRFWLQSKSRFQ